MHKIHAKEFTLEDFSCEHLLGFDGPHNDERDVPYVKMGVNDFSPLGLYKCGIVPLLNECREKYLEISEKLRNDMNHDEKLRLQALKKQYWWQMIQLLPSSYNQTRNVMLNYEVLANIYGSRRNHKLDEWCEFCKWIEELPYSEFIRGDKKEN